MRPKFSFATIVLRRMVPCLALLGACSPTNQPDVSPESAVADAATDAPSDDVFDAAAPVDAPIDAPAGDGATSVDASTDGPYPGLTATTVSARFLTAEHMFASIEMQQSGEPLAEAMGRNLAGFDRAAVPPDLYQDPPPNPDGTGGGTPVLDLIGFSTAVETYEYSKQPMNNLALESGAGVSLAYGPLVNPTGQTGAAALALLRARVQRYGLASRLGVTLTGPQPPNVYFAVPAPENNPANLLGWRGLWPTLVPFRSFDPALAAAAGVSGTCSITAGDGDEGRAGAVAVPVGDYECDYNSLHLSNRDAQVERVFGPASAGWAAWKYSLWVVNYLQAMHDPVGNPISDVPAADLANVGSERNTIVGMTDPPFGDPIPGQPGTYLGSSDIEGFQAQVMIDGLDNAAAAWLTRWSTADGRALTGFDSTAAALAYTYTSPLRWTPSAISVTEASDPAAFPRPTAYAIADSGSKLFDLLGLMGSYATLFTVTDEGDEDVGATQPSRVFFDGAPFAHDNQRADGEDTLHDRSLALARFLFVNVDRLHRNPADDVLVDDVRFDGATPTRGDTVSARTTAYSIVALRTLRRSISSSLTLYSNDTPDARVVRTVLDGVPLAGAPGGMTLADRVSTVLRAQAELLYNRLTDASGNALPGWNVRTNAPTATTGDLDSHAAAIRGLLEAFLATGEPRYRDRALTVFTRMDRVFFDPGYRVYRSAEAAGSPIAFTPARFGTLEGALRELYKLVGARPGREDLAALLQGRLARLHKLVLNGWDDRNNDGRVQWPQECAQIRGGLPGGGLQMAERALTGELGVLGTRRTPDRDQDCVPELSYARLPSALAAEVRFAPMP